MTLSVNQEVEEEVEVKLHDDVSLGGAKTMVGEDKASLGPIFCHKEVLKRKILRSQSGNQTFVEYSKVTYDSVVVEAPKFDPLAKLNKKELLAFRQMRQMVDESEELGEYRTNIEYPSTQMMFTNMSLLRFLRARDYNVKKSFALFVEAMEWRRKYLPGKITAEETKESASMGKQYRNGFDKEGNPTVYMWPAREQGEDEDKRLRLSIYTLEKAIETMSEEFGIERVNWIVDYTDFHGQNQTSLRKVKEFVKIFGDYYPERLHKIFICDAPFYVNLFFKLLRPFVPTKTIEKVVLIKGGAESRWKTFQNFFDKDQLEVQNGGTLAYKYNHDIHWTKEISTDSDHRTSKELPH
eukprot:Nk52_evm23s279 gene=Nk52_evmTU23s279